MPRQAPDYGPRNRLDPKWRPGVGTRQKRDSEPDKLGEPWMYSQRSLSEHRRMAPAQRTTLWLLLLTAVAAAGLVAYSMSGMEDGRHWSLPAMQAQHHEKDRIADPSRQRSVPALAAGEDELPNAGAAHAAPANLSFPATRTQDRQQAMAPSTLDAPDETRLTVLKPASALSAVPVVPQDVPAAPSMSAKPAPAPAPAPVVAGPKADTQLSPVVAPAERYPEATRSQEAKPAPGTDRQCSQAQQAMQLCSVRSG
ncbi:MAG: hypothetical protein ACJ8G3_15185 [Burkholderiaceae bacterium]